MNIILNIMYFFFGTIIGSYANMLSYRYVYSKSIWSKSRSYCPSCNHDLSWYNLIPVLSYLFQRGKCSYCKKKIGSRYLLLELFSGLIFMLIMNNIPLSYSNIYFIFGILMFLIPILVIDVMIHLIYDGYIKSLIILTTLFLYINEHVYNFGLFIKLPTTKQAIIGLVCIYLGGYLLNKIGGQLIYGDYRFDLFGMGDIKLVAWMYMILGTYIEITLIFIFAAFIGLILYVGHQFVFHTLFYGKSKNNIVKLNLNIIDSITKKRNPIKIRLSEIVNKTLFDTYHKEKKVPYTFLLHHLDEKNCILKLHCGKLKINVKVSPEVINKIKDEAIELGVSIANSYITCDLQFNENNYLESYEYSSFSNYEIYLQSMLRSKSFGIEGLPFAPALIFSFIMFLIWGNALSIMVQNIFIK